MTGARAAAIRRPRRIDLVMLVMAASIAACGAAAAQGDGSRGRGPEPPRQQGHDNGPNRRGDDHGQRSRGHDWQREHWRKGYPAQGRIAPRRPDIYYSAPPVVIMPPAYQRPQPGLSLHFGFPLYY